MDPLERIWHGRAVVLLTTGTVLVALGLGAAGGAPTALPGVALGSPALLHVERALVLGAGMASTFIFLIRGWVGYFPSKLSTTGAEYAARATADKATENAGEVAAALAEIKLEHLTTTESVDRDIDMLRQGLRVLGAEVGLGSDIDDIVGEHGTG